MMDELPSGWTVVRASAIAEVQGGIQKQPKRKPFKNSYPFLRVANVSRGRLDLSSVHQVELFDGEIEKYRLHDGDLLVVEGNGSPDQIGRAALWRNEIPNCVHQNHLIRVRPGPAVDQAYLSYYWNAPQAIHYLRSVASSTSGLYVLTAAKVRSVEVPLPPLSEQRRIVAAIEEQFSRLDAGVAALERARRNLRAMRTAVLQSAVSGELAGLKVTGWPRLPLGNLIKNINAGKSFKCEERPARLDEWGVIKVSAMTWGQFREQENKTVLPGHEFDRRMEIRPGDLLVSRANTVEYVGAVVMVGNCRPRLLLSDKSLRVEPTAEVLPEWIVIALRSPESRRYIEQVATGTSDSMRNISQPKLKALEIPVPPVDIQQRLIGEVERIMSLVDQVENDVIRQLRSANRLRASILSRAFAGRFVSQVPGDEPVSILVERIARERAPDGYKPRAHQARRTRVVT